MKTLPEPMKTAFEIATTLKNCDIADTEIVQDRILEVLKALQESRRLKLLNDDAMKYVFVGYLRALNIYKRPEIILALMLDPLRKKNRPLRKDALYTLVEFFGSYRMLLDLAKRNNLCDPDLQWVADLEYGGYWENVTNLIAEQGITDIDETYSGQDLAKQWKRLKKSDFKNILFQREMTYARFIDIMSAYDGSFVSDHRERAEVMADLLASIYLSLNTLTR